MPCAVEVVSEQEKGVQLDFTGRTGSPLDATLEADGWRVNRSQTAQALLDQSEALVYAEYGILGKIQDTATEREATLAIDISVEWAGTYALTLSGGKLSEGGLCDVLIDGARVGQYDFSGRPGAGEKASLGAVYLEAGEHTVALRSIKQDGKGMWLYPATVSLQVRKGKTSSTLYTAEKVAAARENVERYDWARVLKEAAIARADKYVDQTNLLWSMIPSEGIPRAFSVGFVNDPEAYTCRYCKTDLRAKYGSYAWIRDAFSMPWKIQCPACRRQFPSNDFAGYYQAGLDEHGNFNYEKAQAEGQEFLKNVLYPEKDKDGVTGWGVDDGVGYRTGKT